MLLLLVWTGKCLLLLVYSKKWRLHWQYGRSNREYKIENFWQYSLNTFLFQLLSWRRKLFVNVMFPEIFGRFLTTSSLVGRLRDSFMQKFISGQLTALFPASRCKNYGKILFELSLLFITISGQINMEGSFKLYR